MVATVETISEPKLHGKRCGASIPSAHSAVNKSAQSEKSVDAFVSLSPRGETGIIGSGGDQYVGLDQFGRVVDQNWVDTSTGQSVDNLTYSYDANSNVTAENNLLSTAYSQTFTYDQLNRLAGNTLGGAANQSWTLDSQGNWSSFTSNGTTQTQTANAQNQITSISGAAGTPTYDANGNMTTDQNGNTLVYNAWNQLVAVKNSAGAVIAQYTYDARGYRVSETYSQGGTGIPAGTTKYLYSSNQEQVVEDRWNGTANSNVQYQYVWSAGCVNAMVLRDTYGGGTLQAAARIYTTYDANYDVTSLIGYNSTTQTWGVTERFAYSPYGTAAVLSPSGTVTADGFNWQYMYQGGRQDPVTGLYHFDHRDYSPSLGTWISQDPMQCFQDDNLYEFELSSPIAAVDPTGTTASTYGQVLNVIGNETSVLLPELKPGTTPSCPNWDPTSAAQLVQARSLIGQVARKYNFNPNKVSSSKKYKLPRPGRTPCVPAAMVKAAKEAAAVPSNKLTPYMHDVLLPSNNGKTPAPTQGTAKWPYTSTPAAAYGPFRNTQTHTDDNYIFFYGHVSP